MSCTENFVIKTILGVIRVISYAHHLHKISIENCVSQAIDVLGIEFYDHGSLESIY